MGKRSRKRVADSAAGGHHTTRAERDAARRDRARRLEQGKTPDPRPRQRTVRPPVEDRPPAFWAPFPLTELLTLAGIVLMVWGFLSGPKGNGNAKIAAGLAIASIGGLELALREHLTGFRSHSTLLAGAAAIITMVICGYAIG